MSTTPVQLRPAVRISLSLTGAGGRLDMGDRAPPPVTLATLQQIFIGATGPAGAATLNIDGGHASDTAPAALIIDGSHP